MEGGIIISTPFIRETATKGSTESNAFTHARKLCAALLNFADNTNNTIA